MEDAEIKIAEAIAKLVWDHLEFRHFIIVDEDSSIKTVEPMNEEDFYDEIKEAFEEDDEKLVEKIKKMIIAGEI